MHIKTLKTFTSTITTPTVIQTEGWLIWEHIIISLKFEAKLTLQYPKDKTFSNKNVLSANKQPTPVLLNKTTPTCIMWSHQKPYLQSRFKCPTEEKKKINIKIGSKSAV